MQQQKNIDTQFREKMKERVDEICKNHGAFTSGLTDSSESDDSVSFEQTMGQEKEYEQNSVNIDVKDDNEGLIGDDDIVLNKASWW